jgi:hypothetical protein
VTTTELTTFRVFFADGTTADVDAANPYDARAAAQKGRDAAVTKVKRVREEKANA